MTPPIINLPQRQGRMLHNVSRMFTALAWLGYLYLWLPLLTLVAWAFGLHTAYALLYRNQDAAEPYLLLALPLIALVCGVVLIGWAEYNRVRFSGPERRHPMPPVDDAQVAVALGADTVTAGTLRGNRIVVLSLDEQARPKVASARPVGDSQSAGTAQ